MPQLRRGPVLLTAVLVAALSLLAPTTPAAAEPAPSTMQVVVGAPPSELYGIDLAIYLRSSLAYPTGEVSITEGGVELARAPLTLGQGYVNLPAPDLGPRTLTVTYQGSADFLGSTVTTTVDVGPSVLPYPATGTLTSGGSTSTIAAGTLAVSSGVLYDRLTGYLTADLATSPFTRSGDVPGFGP
ncbi:MAG: hypothetical protein ACXV8G_15460, partial [Acidimicrobiales bacterium]